MQELQELLHLHPLALASVYNWFKANVNIHHWYTDLMKKFVMLLLLLG